MSDTQHHAVVCLDRKYLRSIADHRRVTRADVQDGYMVTVECSDPGACPGWIECDGDHTGFDPDDEASPAYDEWEGVMIHGVPHDWNSWGWSVPYAGCPMTAFAREQDFDGIDRSRPGRWLLDVDWDDDECYMTVIREVRDHE